VPLRSSPEQVPRPTRTRRNGRSARWSSTTARTAHTGASTGASAPGWKPTRHDGLPRRRYWPPRLGGRRGAVAKTGRGAPRAPLL